MMLIKDILYEFLILLCLFATPMATTMSLIIDYHMALNKYSFFLTRFDYILTFQIPVYFFMRYMLAMYSAFGLFQSINGSCIVQ